MNARHNQDRASRGANLTTLTDFNDSANVLLTGLGDSDGHALRPFQVIDCNNPMLQRERPR